jgi:hypothetical protein
MGDPLGSAAIPVVAAQFNFCDNPFKSSHTTILSEAV